MTSPNGAEQNKLLAPFQSPLFRAIWIASALSTLGTQMQVLAAGWLMTSLTTSVFLVGLVLPASSAFQLFLAPYAGAVTDVFEKRNILIITQLLLGITTAIMAVLTLTGLINVWGLLILLTLTGVANAFFGICQQAIIQEVVPRQHLSAAVSLTSIKVNTARSLGPALGGMIVAWSGVGVVFLLNALSYLALLFVGFQIPKKPPAEKGEKGEVLRAMRSGLRYVLSDRLLLYLLLRYLLFVGSNTSALALLPLIARNKLRVGAEGLGILSSSFGVGAILGVTTAHWMQQRFGIQKVSRYVMLISCGALLTVALSNTVWLAAIGMALVGYGRFQVGVCYNLSVRLSVEDSIFGRIFSYYQVSIQAGTILGGVVFAAFAGWWGITNSLLAAGAMGIMCFFLSLKHPLPKDRMS